MNIKIQMIPLLPPEKDQTSPEKLACNFSVIHFVVDMEHIHLTGARPHTQDLCRGRVSGLFNLLSTQKVSVILIVAVESTYIFTAKRIVNMY